MTCQEKLNEILTLYDVVSVLADKNNCRILRLRHKELKQDLVVHQLPGDNPAYTLLRDVRHPHLPAVYDTYLLEDGMLVLEEYINGMTVCEVAEVGRYHKRGAVEIAIALCEALALLHEQGIIHRDIKPENVMVDSVGRVVLIDFNAARRLSVASRDTVIMGTIGYAAPEQYGLSQTSERTDIYAVGVLLNTLITGVHPSQTIPKGYLGHIIRKCTSLNPDERYASAKKLGAALARLR